MTISERISNKGYEIYQDMLEKEVLEGPIPSHIAIIMDGNRRYAKEHGKDVREGHLEGKDKDLLHRRQADDNTDVRYYRHHMPCFRYSLGHTHTRGIRRMNKA